MKIPSITPYLSTHLIPIEWWKTELKEKAPEHKGPAIIVAVTTMLVTAVWGKFAAVKFLIMAVATYPLSHRHIQYFMYFDVNGTAQAAACIAIPILCSTVPFMSNWSMPLHVALAYSILNCHWRLCQVARNTSSEIDTLKKLNDTLKTQVSLLEQNSKELESALASLMQEVDHKVELKEEKDRLLKEKEETAIQLEMDYAKLNERIASLAKLCHTAAQTSGLSDQLSQIDENQKKLARLTKDCELKSNTLRGLIQEIASLRDRLQDIFTQATNEQIQSTEKLKLINQWFSAILNRQI